VGAFSTDARYPISMTIVVMEGGVMFDRFKARMTGPGAGDSAPPTRRKGRLNLLAAIAVLLCVGLSASSVLAAPLSVSIRATDLSTLAVSNVGPTVTPSGGTTALVGTVGNFFTNIQVTPFESTGVSDVNTTSFAINNTSSTTATLDVLVSVQGFTLPTYPLLILSSSASGTASTGVLNQPVTLQSFADAANGQFTGGVTPGAHAGLLIGNAPPTQSYNFGATQNLVTLFPRLGTPYSVNQHITITLAGGSNATLTLVTALSAAPLPSTAGLGLVLMGGLGGVGGIRRLNSRRALA